MKIKYCLPIIKTTKEEVINIIEKNINNFDYFEIWLDYIQNLDIGFVKNVSKKLKDRAIFLFRRKNLEKTKISFIKREEIMSSLSNSSSYLDLDIYQQRESLEFIKKQNLRVSTIISYHNYDETPTDKKLNEIVDIITKYDPEVLKISTMCKSHDDGLRLLKLLLDLKTKNIKCIISGMGENGKIAKIFGALWGNEMTFAPLIIAEQSAPGQLTKKQLETVFEQINQ